MPRLGHVDAGSPTGHFSRLEIDALGLDARTAATSRMIADLYGGGRSG